MSEFETIIISMATYVGASGATAAATYSFMTSDYKPPAQERHSDYDVVHNQNGKFKYLYDNGPGFKKWAPFNVHCEEAFVSVLGASAAVQFARLTALWEHPGLLGMKTPDGVYNVHWADNLERSFRIFPKKTADSREYVVTVQFEEG